MPSRGDRGGAATRARIADVATGMFLERGFEDVTIAEVAAAAGVSKVTVFAHFDRKEDLLLDRLPGAVDLVRSAIRDRPDGVGPVEAIRRMVVRLADEKHVLSGLGDGVEPFLRMVVASPALIARLRVFEHQIERVLADELAADSRFDGDADLTAALIVAGYRNAATSTMRRRLAGDAPAALEAAHGAALTAAFAALADGL
ncbi:TetR family transcriptional regulator [Frondihabitans sp. PAMC 28766]|uniref:TetR/AcrR family transcriptional regulator n=1 Tax=Frondihabitans sp. PAMC 28766 TaxID=1795630 RepID=UPI00078CA323|nr:TetR/AcrR family transcriptional regulator [Frondihabitans sp. PAMC 28766]AMM20768.1 TetR family transcriptional regulator [Frondihabitans sp. PAMC 28766]